MERRPARGRAARRRRHRARVAHRARQARRAALSRAPTRQRLAKLQLRRRSSRPPRRGDGGADVVIDVIYDGDDLDEVAELTGLTPARWSPPTPQPRGGSDSAVSHRVSRTWSAVTSGSACRAGRSRAPRCPPVRSALAGEFSGVYPRESPGGWQLIGHTEAELWDVDRDPPALLTPGQWVQFREVGYVMSTRHWRSCAPVRWRSSRISAGPAWRTSA